MTDVIAQIDAEIAKLTAGEELANRSNCGCKELAGGRPKGSKNSTFSDQPGIAHACKGCG